MLDRATNEFPDIRLRNQANAVSHGFARLIQHAVKTPPTTYHGIVHGVAA